MSRPRGLGALVVAIAWSTACGGEDAETMVEGPPTEELFVSQQVPCGFPDQNGERVETCLRLFFSDTVLKAWCVVPDADSFDDYEEYREDPNGAVAIDPQTGLPIVVVPRGKTPAAGSEDCEADGIVTGPDGDDYYPSKFCRTPGCKPTKP